MCDHWWGERWVGVGLLLPDSGCIAAVAVRRTRRCALVAVYPPVLVDDASGDVVFLLHDQARVQHSRMRSACSIRSGAVEG